MRRQHQYKEIRAEVGVTVDSEEARVVVMAVAPMVVAAACIVPNRQQTRSCAHLCTEHHPLLALGSQLHRALKRAR